MLKEFRDHLKGLQKFNNYFVGNCYTELSTTNFCEHSNTLYLPSLYLPTYCFKGSISNCQQECDQWVSCLGYSFSGTSCRMFPSDGSCPGVPWSTSSNTIATTSDQLVSTGLGQYGYNCYRKGNLH